MRNIALIFGLMVLLASQGLAQRSIFSTFNTDTLTNADTAVTPTIEVKDYGDAAFAIVVDSLSGTTAGTIYYQGSIDGTNFFDIATDAINGAGTSTEEHTLSGTAWPYFRMRFITTGTQSTSVKPYFAFKRKD